MLVSSPINPVPTSCSLISSVWLSSFSDMSLNRYPYLTASLFRPLRTFRKVCRLELLLAGGHGAVGLLHEYLGAGNRGFIRFVRLKKFTGFRSQVFGRTLRFQGLGHNGHSGGRSGFCGLRLEIPLSGCKIGFRVWGTVMSRLWATDMLQNRHA